MLSKELDQKLIDYIAKEYKKGNSFWDIKKSLLKSNYPEKIINEGLRVVKILGKETLKGDEIKKIKEDKLYLKKASGLSVYFNIIILFLIFQIFLKGYGSFWLIVNNKGLLHLLEGAADPFYLFLAAILLAVGLYHTRFWAIQGLIAWLGIFAIFALLFDIIRPLYFYGKFNMATIIFPIFNILTIIVISFCFFKISKRFFVRIHKD